MCWLLRHASFRGSARAPSSRIAGKALTSSAVLLCSVATAWALAAAPRYALVAAGALVILVLLLRLPRHLLPPIALGLFALVPTPYLGMSRLFGSFIGPPIIVLAVWEARVLLWPQVFARSVPRIWMLLSFTTAALLATESLASGHLGRSFAWSAAFIVAVPLAAIAASNSGPELSAQLLRVWTWLAIALGTFALLEAAAHRNPLAHHYTINGQALRQTWSVYRIETTLGHPLFNALFFAVTASVMAGLVISKFTFPRALASALSALAVILTASRSGVLAVAIGVGIAVIAASFSGAISLGRRLVIIGVVVAAIVGLSQASVLQQRDRSAEGQSSIAQRSQVVHAAVGIIEHDPIGSGPATSQFRLASTGSRLTFENSILQIGVSTGVPGLLLILGLIGTAARVAVQRGRWDALAAISACVVCVSGFNVWDQIPVAFALLGFAVLAAFSGPSDLPMHVRETDYAPLTPEVAVS